MENNKLGIILAFVGGIVLGANWSKIKKGSQALWKTLAKKVKKGTGAIKTKLAPKPAK